MQKIIKTIESKQIFQITTADERWYAKTMEDPETHLPVYQFVPSVTWICEFYPKGIGFYKWLADKGWDESQAIKEAKGDKGSRVHNAVTKLINGEVIKMEDLIEDGDGNLAPLSVDEYECLMSFEAWWKENDPIVIAQNVTIWNADYNYAGTIDLICKIGEDVWIIDFKTGGIWPSHEIQISAYAHGSNLQVAQVKLGLLQLGYGRNKKGFKFTEVPDQFELFLAARKIWAKETEGQFPKQKDYPMELRLTFTPLPVDNFDTKTEPAPLVAVGEKKEETNDASKHKKVSRKKQL